MTEEEQTLKALKQKRGHYKMQLTIFKKFLAKVDLDDITTENRENISKRATDIEMILERFIENFFQAETLTETESIEELELFQDEAYKALSLAEIISTSHNPTTCQNAGTNQQNLNVKLPTYDLTTFDGNFTKWREFYDQFTNVIDVNPNLSDIEKFTYLRASLKGEPADLIRPLPTTTENYAIALSTLKLRYNNKRRIIRNHVHAILNIPPCTKDMSGSLRDLINILQNNVESLRALNINVDAWDAILIPIVIQKLHTSTINIWESKLNEKCSDEIPTFKEFLSFLTARLNTLESVTDIKQNINTNDNRINKLQTPYPNKSFAITYTSNIKCINCKSNHYLQKCPDFLNMSSSDRYKKAKELNLCTNCLRLGHNCLNCVSSSNCKTCNKRHHTLLHSNAFSTESPKRNATHNSATTNTTVSCTSCQPHSQVLLSTAKVEVMTPHTQCIAKVLLDSASQSNFITEQTCKLLNLKRERVNMQVSSINTALTKITHKVSVTLKSRHNNFTITITCLVVPRITGTLPTFSFPQECVCVPPNIKLADPNFHKSENIDMLLGASIFYNLLCIGQIVKPNFPTLQKTKFGWIISGLLQSSCIQTSSITLHTLDNIDSTLHEDVKIDEFIPMKQELAPDEESCQNLYTNTTLNNHKPCHYVQSSSNPADVISRGLTADKLTISSLWWQGPEFLSLPEKQWPNSKYTTTISENLEQSHSYNLATETTETTEIFPITNYSSITKLKRIVALCLRFKNNCLSHKSNHTVGHITTIESDYALKIILKLTQKVYFNKEIQTLLSNKLLNRKSFLLSLTPFVDNDGLLRVGGRLQLSKYQYNKRHPILLPKNDHLTNIIFIHEHKRLLHASPKLLLNSIRETYWPISGLNTAKRIVRECVTCCRFKANTHKELMGSLPQERVSYTHPFYSTGVDYAGPFILKNDVARSKKTFKGYVCLFICMATKALHLEIVTALSTDAFMAAFKRFIARRGTPCHIFSDNGTNFHGAKNELAKLSEFFKAHSNDLKSMMSNEGIEWHFIPPYAPHLGGLWEAAVKSTKFHIKRVLKELVLTYENFYTVIAQIESILNSRPLTALTTDPNDCEALTPAHFLIGRSFTNIPEPSLLLIPVNRLNLYQHMQKVVQDFWRKWSLEYINQLQQRTKWKHKSDSPVKIGSLVLLKEDHLPPARWHLARITQLHPGQDGVTRVVTVKSANNESRRSITKICVLPVDNHTYPEVPNNSPLNSD